MELEQILEELCASVPSAIGAVVCDYEGETVVCKLGPAPVPPNAEERARDHVPRAMSLTMPVEEFLVRLAGAEPCALLHIFARHGQKRGVGELAMLEFRYEEIDILVHPLPNAYYVVLVLRRPAVAAEAKRHLDHASKLLEEHVS